MKSIMKYINFELPQKIGSDPSFIHHPVIYLIDTTQHT